MSSIQNKRLDLHLYAERLTRHAERVADDLADARLAEAWCDIDDRLRVGLTDNDIRALEVVGILGNDERRANAAASVAHFQLVLHAIHSAQKVAEELQAARRRPEPDPLGDALATYPNCHRCGGKGCANPDYRHLTRCEECDGTGRAPAPAEEPEYVSCVMIVDVSCREGEKFIQNVIESVDPVVHSSTFSGEADAFRWLESKGSVHRNQAAADIADYEQED
jgi:hypothetical protein